MLETRKVICRAAPRLCNYAIRHPCVRIIPLRCACRSQRAINRTHASTHARTCAQTSARARAHTSDPSTRHEYMPVRDTFATASAYAAAWPFFSANCCAVGLHSAGLHGCCTLSIPPKTYGPCRQGRADGQARTRRRSTSESHRRRDKSALRSRRCGPWPLRGAALCSCITPRRWYSRTLS
jgi:hypothetical protein